MIYLLLITGQDCPEWNLPYEASANSTRAWSCRFEYPVKNQSGTTISWDEIQALLASCSALQQFIPICF
jgi:hypothetical protein